MARLGEILVAAGWITAEQCVQALNTQVLWGGRLGTNLIELGFVDVDQVARALGRQFQCPPALSHHFAAADRGVQRELHVDVAERFTCLPLSRSAQGRVVLAAMAPIDAQARAIIAEQLEVRAGDVVVAVAAELRIRYQLERIYDIQRDTRFLRVRGPTPLQPPRFEIEDVELGPELELPDDTPAVPRAMARQAMVPLGRAPTLPPLMPDGTVPPKTARERLVDVERSLRELQDQVEQASIQRAPTRPDRRRYAQTIDATAVADKPVARIPLKRLATGSDAIVPLSLGTQPPPYASTLGEVTRAIRGSADREAVGELAIQAVAQFVPGTAAAVLLLVRGRVAIAHVGFSRAADALPEVVVPLDEPGVLSSAIDRNLTLRVPAKDLGVVDGLVLAAMNVPQADLVATPISIGRTVVGVIAMAVAADEPEASAESITAAAGAAYARLMRDASR